MLHYLKNSLESSLNRSISVKDKRLKENEIRRNANIMGLLTWDAVLVSNNCEVHTPMGPIQNYLTTKMKLESNILFTNSLK